MTKINFKYTPKLFLIFLILNFPMNSEGKELTMKCTSPISGIERIFKYKGGLFKKEIFERIDSEWKTWCVKKNYVVSLEVNDEGGVCKQRKLPMKSVTEDGTKVYCDVDTMLDFKFRKKNKRHSCSEGSSGDINWDCYYF